VEVAGLDVCEHPGKVRERIGLSGQTAAVDEHLTGYENLEMVGRLYGLPRKEARRRADEVLERFGLAEAAARTAKTYSGGMRRRLDLAASLVGRPEVLFLDEPTTGLDPGSRIDVWAFIRELQDEGTTLLLTTQYLDEADQLADRIVVIDVGTVIAEGTSDELKDRIGGEVMEIHVEESIEASRAAEALKGLGTGEPYVDLETRLVRLPVGSEGPAVLLDSVRRLDDLQIPLSDIALHKPTLDDVFLSLTGHAAADGAGPEPGAPKRARRDRREGGES
jgi:ABC-2 type transport system ATP-binding protein